MVPDGRELFYRQGGRATTRMMVVPISSKDDFRQLGPPREVFSGDYVSSGPLDTWVLAPDGRFIMEKYVSRPASPTVTRINMVLNWFAELNRLVPGKK